MLALGVLKKPAFKACPIALVVAVLLALTYWKMPVKDCVTGGLEGVAMACLLYTSHIACKTLDFEKSVTLTFGLPFIRSSVDHGTAFDIAGKGIAGCISMIESTKVVAEYAAKQHEKKEA